MDKTKELIAQEDAVEELIVVAEKSVKDLSKALYFLRATVHYLPTNDNDSFNEVDKLLQEILKVRDVLQNLHRKVEITCHEIKKKHK